MTAPAVLTEPARILIAIAGSAGAIPILSDVVAALPADLRAAVAIVQHRSPALPSVLPAILRSKTRLRVEPATDGRLLEHGVVYVAPPDRHLQIDPDKTMHLVDGRRIRHVRSSANPLLDSAAPVFGKNLLAIVLSGYDHDATDGVQSVAAAGGTVIVQDPLRALAGGMPLSAMKTGVVRSALPAAEIAPAILRFVAEHQ